MPENRKRAVVLANRAFGTLESKTANDLVIYGSGKYDIWGSSSWWRLWGVMFHIPPMWLN
jgi:hypothetical protein